MPFLPYNGNYSEPSTELLKKIHITNKKNYLRFEQKILFLPGPRVMFPFLGILTIATVLLKVLNN